MTDEEKKITEDELQKEIVDEEERLKIEADKEAEKNKDKDWRGEALKQTAIANRLKNKLSKVPPPITQVPNKEQKVDDEVVQSVKKLEQAEAKRQFGFEHNLSPQETDLAFRFANGAPTKATLDDEFFKGGLESLRSKQRLANNTPGSSSRSSVFTEKPLAELSEAERKSSFEKAVSGAKK